MNDFTDDDDEGSGVDALHRFMTDQQAQRNLSLFTAAYSNSLHDNDEDMEAADLPELSRNDKVLLLQGIFELFDDIVGDKLNKLDDTMDEDDGEELAAMKRRRETAKDKRMSTFYKAFMGNMRELVNPWHSDRNKFASLWVDMGNDLYTKSPSKEPKHPVELVVQPVEEQDDQETEDQIDSDVGEEEANVDETAAIIGAEAALPGKVARELAEMGFVAVKQPHSGDAAWVKDGAEDGCPDMKLYLVKREEGSYAVFLSKDYKYDAYGKPVKRQLLDENATDKQILSVLAFMYDSMTQV